MAKEIQFTDATGKTDYVVFIDTTGLFYNGVTGLFEVFNAANWTDYAFGATEFGSTGIYEADMVSVSTSGKFSVVAKRQLGGVPAVSDTTVADGEIDWNAVRSEVAAIGASLPTQSGWGAANGLMILGTNNAGISLAPPSGPGLSIVSVDNSGVAIQGDGGPGVSISGGNQNQPGLSITGGSGGANGHGILITAGGSGAYGIKSTGNTTGHGASFIGGSNGVGVSIFGEGNGQGMTINGAGGGAGIAVNGGATADAVILSSGAFGNGNGMTMIGHGTGDGLHVIGGAGAGGDGIEAVAGGGVPIRGNLEGSVTSVVNGVTLTAAALDAILIEAGITPSAVLVNDSGVQLSAINARQALAVCLSALAGILAGGAGPTTTMKPAALPAGNNRISAAVDGSGNRTALTLTVPD